MIVGSKESLSLCQERSSESPGWEILSPPLSLSLCLSVSQWEACN
jgi:hypothetical protein